MGLEAMSRGAAFALFIDNDVTAISVIKSNIDACGFDKNQTIANKQNVLKLGPNPLEKYDLAFLDAPYDTGLNEETMPILLANGWLKSGAIVVSENRKGQIASALDGFELLREVNYGINGFVFYTVKPTKFQD
ncbi:MAG: hypothetical protein FD163_1550 [Hyphomonadaceae bacterium]|nr:MAG: hypothetical protein FD163_1550 [Hyphomonadaceae bacterium]